MIDRPDQNKADPEAEAVFWTEGSRLLQILLTVTLAYPALMGLQC